MADDEKSCTETLAPRLVSFLQRERKLARSFVLVATSGDVVDEWDVQDSFATDDIDLANIAELVLKTAIDYAKNAEQRIEFMLRARDAVLGQRGTMRFRVKYVAESERQFADNTPEGKLLKFLFTQNEKKDAIINALPSKAIEVYEGLLAASSREIERLSKVVQDQQLEIRMLHEAMREGVVSDAAAAEAEEAAETDTLAGEVRDLATAIIKKATSKATDKPDAADAAKETVQ